MPENHRKDHIQYLLLRYLDQTSSEAETRELFDYLADEENKELFGELTEELMMAQPEMEGYDAEKWQSFVEGLKEYNAQETVRAPVRRLHFFKHAAARWVAAALLLLIAGYFIIRESSEATRKKADIAVNRNETDILPGSNKALLTLSTGQSIVLDEVANGTISQDGSATIVKLDNGRIVYKPGGDDRNVVYNTMSTPRGGQYNLTLPDGTVVWLNAASSITYPTTFQGSERNVRVTGEVYFEVAKNAKMPFHVKANEMNIEVLGTHFNVNAYPDEPVIKTTLLEGSVRVSSNGANSILKPGQQAHVNKEGRIDLVPDANTEEAIAWKNGRFYFDEADIQSIMRQVERWYDVKVVYAKEVPEGHYKGRPSRNLTLTQMLKVFEYSGLKFKIDDKTIIVME